MYTFLNQVSTRVFKPAYAQFFGRVNPPPGVSDYGGAEGAGLITFLNNIMKILIAGAGIYAVLNFIIAGYDFISAGGDADKITTAWNKIWQSALGLLIAGGAFVIAAIFSKLIFGNWGAILNPTIYGPR